MRLTETLSELCRTHPLTEKWLLAPSRRVGYQWLDRLAADGTPAINMRVRTLRFMAFELAAPRLAGLGLGFLSRSVGTFLVGVLFERLRGRGSGYLLAQPAGEGLFDTLLGALTDLRLAGLSPEALAPRRFEDPGKAEDLRLLLTEYLRELERRRLTDYAGLLELASARLQNDSTALPALLRVLLPGCPRLSRLEKRLLGLLPPGCLLRTENEDACVRRGFDPQRLGAALAPEGGDALHTSIFRAVGESNEVRAVLREVLGSGAPLDRVEVLHTDSAVYVPLFYEIVRACLPAGEWNSPLGLPLTFAEGIPLRLTRPGRALAAWLDWQAQGYPQSALTGMLQEGLLELGQAPASGAELAAVLRRVPLGLGRSRYSPGLAVWLENLQSRLKTSGQTDEDSDPSGAESLSRQIELTRWLKDFTGRLLDITPELDPHDPVLLARAADFLERFARTSGEPDNFARKSLCERLDELRPWASESGGGLDLRAHLAGLLDSVSVLGANPAPGCLHVANLRSGGHSGRPVTFILGLDDSRFPGGAIQDPVLLDSERTVLSGSLPTAAARQEQGLADFCDLIGGLSGELHLGFSCRSLEDSREMFPSPVLLQIFRRLSGEPEADQGRMLEYLPAAASFAPAPGQACLDGSEWWLRELCPHGSADAARPVVEKCFPFLEQGRLADRARHSGHLTGYDGFVPEAGRDLDPTLASDRVMSPSAFEHLGRCPLAYFFQYALRLKPPEDYDADLSLWLDHRQAGSLLHEVFHKFIRSLIEQGAKPEDTPAQRDLLAATLERVVGRYRAQYPPATEGAYHRRRRELERTAAVFLAEEAEHCRRSTPFYLEWSIGMQEDPQAGDTSEAPGAIRLPDGRTLRLRGRIDRVDREPDGAFVIWDYKTGSASRFSLSDPLKQGRVVQPALYLELAGGALRGLHGESARAAAFGFFFPGPRGQGRRLRWRREDLVEWGDTLTHLCDSLAAGAFIATDADSTSGDPPDCVNCDYRAACGDLHRTVAASSDKRRNLENTALEPFRLLRPEKGEA
ncbi:PD-(D/E)XK nuclease family protein [bacterium]|nr:PD-(D/E)XK nuclease family protein [bacterium]